MQGTAIRRANTDSVELDRRASPRQIAREAAAVLEAEGPSEAESFIEGAYVAAPSLTHSPAFSNMQERIRRARSYERDVQYAIESTMDPEVILLRNQSDDGFDFTLYSHGPYNGTVRCVLKYSEGVQRGVIKSLRDIVLRSQDRIIPVLIITNYDVDNPLILRQIVKDSDLQGIEIVRWRNPNDNEKLGQVIDRMINPPRENETLS